MSDRRQKLEFLLERLEEAMAVVDDRDIPPLSREIRQVLAEIDSLPDTKASAPADEIARRREERRAAAARAQAQ